MTNKYRGLLTADELDELVKKASVEKVDNLSDEDAAALLADVEADEAESELPKEAADTDMRGRVQYWGHLAATDTYNDAIEAGDDHDAAMGKVAALEEEILDAIEALSAETDPDANAIVDGVRKVAAENPDALRDFLDQQGALGEETGLEESEAEEETETEEEETEEATA